MKRCWMVLLLLVVETPGRPQDSADREVRFDRDLRPLLARYCTGCHGGAKPKAELNLALFSDEASVFKSRKVWKKVLDVLYSREMPPADKPQPAAQERDRLTGWIEAALARPDAAGRRDPGRPVLRRLNSTEYNNTVIDLFGIQRMEPYFKPAQGMPENVRYNPLRSSRRVVAELPPDDTDYGFDNIGEVLTLPPFLLEKYLSVAAEAVDTAYTDRNGGRVARDLRGSRTKTRDGARGFLAAFLERAFRRPPSAAEVESYLKLYDQAARDGAAYEDAMRVPLQAILVSPHFIFRVEGDAASAKAGVRAVDDWELATRLSYFLWSSLPDEELFALARKGALRDPTTLEAQVRRMLKDPRVKELGTNFCLQWLQLAGIESAMPDPMLFKTFYSNAHIPRSMRQEALLLFETILVEDRSVLEFVDPGWTWLNGPLARHYGIDPPKTGDRERDTWRRVTLTDARRGGILTLGAVLTVTSLPTRTSPVKRGKWVLETVLGAPPPPPPPDVPDLKEDAAREEGPTLRKRLEQHRTNPNCAGCHNRIDPIGFAFEQYDPIGAWRQTDGKNPADASAVLSDGTRFEGAAEFKKLLVTRRRDDFVRCLAEKMLTYALGRKLEYYDASAVRGIVEGTARDGHRFSRLVVEIVKSYPFLHRRTGEMNDE